MNSFLFSFRVLSPHHRRNGETEVECKDVAALAVELTSKVATKLSGSLARER